MGGAGGGYIGGGTGGRQFFIYDYIKSGTAISSSAGSAGTLGKGANGINSTVGNTNNQGGSMGGSAGGLSYINESMFINTEIIAGASDKTKPSNADNNGYAIIERID